MTCILVPVRISLFICSLVLWMTFFFFFNYICSVMKIVVSQREEYILWMEYDCGFQCNSVSRRRMQRVMAVAVQ